MTTFEKRFSVTTYNQWRKFAESKGFKVHASQTESFEAFGKSMIIAQHKKFHITVTYDIGDKTKLTDIFWDEPRGIRTNYVQAREFADAIKAATMVAEKLNALKAIPLKK